MWTQALIAITGCDGSDSCSLVECINSVIGAHFELWFCSLVPAGRTNRMEEMEESTSQVLMIFVHWYRNRKHKFIVAVGTHSELWLLTRMLDTHALIATVDCWWVDCTDWNAQALIAMVMADGWKAQ